MKNKLSIFIAAMCLTSLAFGQLFVNGTTFFIAANTTVQVNADVRIQAPVASSILQNNGTLALTGHYENFGNYKYTGTTSTMIMEGSTSSNLRSGAKNLYKLHIKKTAGANVALTQALTVNKEIQFFNNNTFLQLGSNHLTMAAAANFVGTSASRFVVTNDVGQLKKTSCATFTFPVGFNTTTYNPVTIVESGTKDVKGVRCLNRALAAGSTGAAITQGNADVSWEISESAAGGSNASLTFQWAGSDEQNLFNRAVSSVHQFASGAWSGAAGTAASGANPYTQVRAGVNSFGYFMVATPGAFSTPPQQPSIAQRGEAESEKGVQIYPNPTDGKFQILTTEPIQKVIVRDQRGRLMTVFSSEGNSWTLLNAPSGIYWVEVLGFDNRVLDTKLLMKI